MKIGIIGLGFVGSAIKNAYDVNQISTVCRDPAKGINNSIDDLKTTDGIFISVPSPQKDDGSCDITILESVLKDLEGFTGVLISKVTAPPNVYKDLIKKYPNLVHAPEFLVAATAKEDYLTGDFSIIGGDKVFCEKALSLIKLGQTNIKKYKFCTIEEASLSKYAINCFLSTKVIFMNQLKLIADSTDINFNTIKECIKFDSRLGHSHFDAPGPDGLYGFGGACFPKDTSAMLFYSKLLKKDFTLLEAAIEINKDLRNE
jgi:UDPglucose 6-dehydrogenase